MNKRQFLPRRAAERAYSIAEIVISMALIVMLTVTGFTVCYISLRLQNRSAERMYIQNISDAVNACLPAAQAECGGPFEDRTEQKNFVLAFNKYLSFALNVTPFNLRDFTGEYVLDGDGWAQEIILASDTIYTAERDENGNITEEQKTIVKQGVSVSYRGNHSDIFAFDYRYFTEDLEIRAALIFEKSGFSFTVEGYTAGWSEEEERYTADSDKPVCIYSRMNSYSKGAGA